MLELLKNGSTQAILVFLAAIVIVAAVFAALLQTNRKSSQETTPAVENQVVLDLPSPSSTPFVYTKCSTSQVLPDLNVNCLDYEKNTNLYTELLNAPVVQIALRREQNKDVRFEIVEIHQKNILYLDVGLQNGGGSALWVQKTDNEWKSIYAGQERPNCKLLEDLKIESGVECSDPVTFERSTTK
jgi:hypothetical protein